MEFKQIKELMSAMEKAGIKRLRIKDKEEYEIELERMDDQVVIPSFPSSYTSPDSCFKVSSPLSHSSGAEGLSLPQSPVTSNTNEKNDGKFVKAPLVGILYLSPLPEDPPFVKVGDVVTEQTVVAIIEAMKVMSEVRAGIAGTIVEVLIPNGHPVDFGTKLFKIV